MQTQSNARLLDLPPRMTTFEAERSGGFAVALTRKVGNLRGSHLHRSQGVAGGYARRPARGIRRVRKFSSAAAWSMPVATGHAGAGGSPLPRCLSGLALGSWRCRSGLRRPRTYHAFRYRPTEPNERKQDSDDPGYIGGGARADDCAGHGDQCAPPHHPVKPRSRPPWMAATDQPRDPERGAPQHHEERRECQRSRSSQRRHSDGSTAGRGRIRTDQGDQLEKDTPPHGPLIGRRFPTLKLASRWPDAEALFRRGRLAVLPCALEHVAVALLHLRPPASLPLGAGDLLDVDGAGDGGVLVAELPGDLLG